MGKTFSNSSDSGQNRALGLALERMDALVDWEKRDRSRASQAKMRVSLGPIADLTKRIGSPERAFRAVHVAGSKGKGSTAFLIRTGLGRAGKRVGLYVSPHVEQLRERISIDGRMISHESLGQALGRVLDVREQALSEGSEAGHATWFDVLTAAAFLHFREREVDLAVLESGLGGRLDSTNGVQPLLIVLTAIEREHTAILGSTLESIAGEKAGIMAPGVPGVSADARSTSVVGGALRAAAATLGVSLLDVPEARQGTLAQRNIALARAALGRLGTGSCGLCDQKGRPVGPHLLGDDSPQALCGGLPGRLERLDFGGLPVVLDGAHVPASLEAILEELGSESALSGPLQCVFGCGSDKDALGLLKTLANRADRTLCTSAGVGPYASPSELASLGASVGLKTIAFDDVTRALIDALKKAKAAGGWVLVTGSLHLVGALRPTLRQHHADDRL